MSEQIKPKKLKLTGGPGGFTCRVQIDGEDQKNVSRVQLDIPAQGMVRATIDYLLIAPDVEMEADIELHTFWLDARLYKLRSALEAIHDNRVEQLADAPEECARVATLGPGPTCIREYPDDPSEWCDLCIAKAVLGDPELVGPSRRPFAPALAPKADPS